MITGPFQANSLSASLTCNDLKASLAWYCDVIGFTITQEHKHEEKLRAARITAGEVSLLLNQDNGEKGAARAVGTGMSFYIVTSQNLDELAARIKKNGGTLDMEPTKMQWGPTALRVIDPNGFKITISSG